MKMYLTPKTYSLAIVMALSCFSCKKDPIDTLPPATHKGKNTFGCLIDGEPFIAEVELGVNKPAAASATYNQNNGFFDAQGKKDLGVVGYENIYLYAYVLNGLGAYPVDIGGEEQLGYRSQGSGREYYFDINNPGTVSITYLNPSKNIISGTFQFTLVNPAYSDSTMVITDGRFDITYH